MQKQFELVTVGDSTIDTFLKIHDATVECDINQRNCKICITYGSKIPVDAIFHGVAGNAANVAVGARLLGTICAIYTNLGDDDSGKTILEAFENASVDTSFVKINKRKKSNLSVVLTFQGERTIFVYHQDWFYHLPNFGQTSWVYLTSMAETFTNSDIVGEICNYIDKSGAKLAFNPGTYQLKADIKRYPRLLEKCEVLIVNLEEAKRILNISEAQIIEMKDLLSGLLLLGPKKVVITDGTRGSLATEGHHHFKVGIIEVEVVEKTGAGDAYTSGLLSALISGESLDEAMIWGTINASYVVRKVGTQNGLLNKSDLLKERKKYKQLKVVNF